MFFTRTLIGLVFYSIFSLNAFAARECSVEDRITIPITFGNVERITIDQVTHFKILYNSRKIDEKDICFPEDAPERIECPSKSFSMTHACRAGSVIEQKTDAGRFLNSIAVSFALGAGGQCHLEDAPITTLFDIEGASCYNLRERIEPNF